MKKMLLLVAIALVSTSLFAAPLRVLLLDFENAAGGTAALTNPSQIAGKGVYLLSKQLLDNENFVLVDRREFISQMEKLKLTDAGAATPVQPTFIHAAQQLGADVILRGTLLSLSEGKETVDQGGYRTDFTVLTSRVALEALDAKDGSVIAMSEGSSSRKIRQTATQQTSLGEDEVLSLLDKAVAQAVPSVQQALESRMVTAALSKIKISIKTTDDPAMVEIDGSLVGSTPLEGLEIAAGDHVLRVSRAGYRDITRRIVLEKDASIEVPMMRVELDALEQKEVLKEADVHIFSREPDLIIHTIE
ncbi:MAG: PEGA domain-containing protein [Kiritimatiellae bacterium]|nr:PEGA domain-containing protein [Kiritimatiellia bacterium]